MQVWEYSKPADDRFFEHIIIPNFLNENYAEDIYNKFPTDFETDNWHKYMNPIEVKYANDYKR